MRISKDRGAPWLWLLAAWLAAACVSSREAPGLGGESHFLQRCATQCGTGLDCIQGVCTRGCVVGKDSCGDLFSAAVCTAGSIEPGEVAVCDLACSEDGDCAALSASHHCDNGFCRAPAGAISGADKPDAGAGGFPYPTDKVFECPASIATDPADVSRSIVQGDVLVLSVGTGGGCAQHSFAVCFDSGFRESYPVQTTLRLIHESNDDPCLAFVSRELRIDLKPLAKAYERAYRSSAGLVSTNFGMYAFGELSCKERELGAAAQVEGFARNVARACQTDLDCSWPLTSTRCSAGCGTVASRAGAAEMVQWLEATNTAVCRDYAGDGCGPLLTPPCDPPVPPACIDGQCQAVSR